MTPAAQHLATRRAAGLFDFSFMSLHEIDGAGAHAYLERVQSRSPRALAPGRIAYTLLLGEDGRVFIDATLWRRADGRWWLFTGRRSDHAWLAARAEGLDVRLRERSGEYAVLALQGPASGAILARALGADTVRALRYFGFVERGGAVIGRLGYSGELGYEILVPAARAAAERRALLEAGREFGIAECSFEAADSLRIESGYVLFDREVGGRERPEELGLERLLERAARPPAPARRLTGLEILQRPALASARPDLPLARVTSECDSPVLSRRIGLGFVGTEARAGDFVRLRDGRLARIARLPFYDPARRLPRGDPL